MVMALTDDILERKIPTVRSAAPHQDPDKVKEKKKELYPFPRKEIGHHQVKVQISGILCVL